MGMIMGIQSEPGLYPSLRVLGPQKALADTDALYIAFIGC